MKFFRDILTEDDNKTFCAARTSVMLGVVAFIAIAFVQVIKNGSIDLSSLGIGFGSVLGGGGVLVGGKAATQHDSQRPTE
jgi:hypothetical protein